MLSRSKFGLPVVDSVPALTKIHQLFTAMRANGDQPPVSVVIIGGGIIARTHAKCLIESPSTTLVAIIDPFETGLNLARSLSIPHFPSLSEFLDSSKDGRVDIYMICTPSGLHVPVAQEVLNTTNPKLILVEKPISTDIQAGEQLLRLAEEKGCQVAVGHHRRFHPVIATAKKTLASGAVGNLTAISGLWTCKKNDGYFTQASWRTSRQSGGGPIWTNLVHDFDALQYLVGSRIVRLWATPSPRRRRHPDVEDADSVEEGAAVMLQFGNGIVGTMVICDNVPSPYSWEAGTGENVGIAKAEVPVDSWRFFGSQGTFSVPDGCLWTYDEQEAARKGVEPGWGTALTRKQVNADDESPYKIQIEHLVRVVREGERPICSGKDGLAAVRACQAIIDALDNPSRGPVEVGNDAEI